MASHSDPAKQPAATELKIMLIKQVERTSAEPQLLQLYHSSHSTLTRDWSVRLPSFTSFYRLSRLFLWDNSCRSRWRDLTLHYSPMLKRSRKPCERHKGRAKGKEMKGMLEKVKKAGVACYGMMGNGGELWRAGTEVLNLPDEVQIKRDGGREKMKKRTPRGEFIIIQMSLYHLLPPKLTKREKHIPPHCCNICCIRKQKINMKKTKVHLIIWFNRWNIPSIYKLFLPLDYIKIAIKQITIK